MDAQRSPFHRMGFDPELEGGFGEVGDANRRIVQFWGPGSSLDGKPDFKRVSAVSSWSRSAEERHRTPGGTLFATSRGVSLVEIGASFARYRPRPTRSIFPAFARFQRCEPEYGEALELFRADLALGIRIP